MRALFLTLVLCLLAMACGGGTDTGNPNSPQNQARVSEGPFDDPADGCQEPFRLICIDGTPIEKDPVTCEWEECH